MTSGQLLVFGDQRWLPLALIMNRNFDMEVDLVDIRHLREQNRRIRMRFR
jgi:hypothetical protein